MSQRVSFAKAAAWSLFGRSIGIGGSFVVSLCLARVMSPDDLGAFFALQTTVIFLATIARGGLQQPIVKAVAEAHAAQQFGRAGKVLSLTMFLVLAISSVLGPILYLFGFDWLANAMLGRELPDETKMALCLWVALLAFQVPISEVLRGLSKIGAAVLTDGTISTLAVAACLFLVIARAGDLELSQAVALFSTAVLASVIWGCVSLFKARHMLSGQGTQSFGALIGMARSTFLINIATLLFSSASIWIASALLSAESTALLGVSTRLASLATISLLVINIAIQPYIAALLAEDRRDQLEALLQSSAFVAGIPAVLVTVALVAFGEEILTLLYGNPYGAASMALSILAFGNLVNVITGSCGQVLIFAGHARHFVVLTLGSGSLSVLASSLLAVPFDIVGIAVGQCAGIVLLNGLAWRYARQVIGIRTNPKWDKRVLSFKYLTRRARDS